MGRRFVAAHKRAALPIAAALVALAAAAACFEDGATDGIGTDAGLGDSAIATAVCPAAAPDAGTRCTLPEGTTCGFGRCGTVLAECTGGVWLFGSNPPPAPVCPSEPPATEAPCPDPECWPADASCFYGSQDCTSPDASLNTSIAWCIDRRWTLDVRPCRDAGADVQGDAEPDGD